MAIYGSQCIENKIQEIRYSATTAYLFWTPKLAGVDVIAPTAQYTIYNSGGSLLTATSAAMGSSTLTSVESEGWLGFTALSTRWNIGATISNASAGFTATIRGVQYTSTTAGRVYLTDIYKTPTSGSVLVDNGDTPGGATVNGQMYSPLLYARIGVSDTDSYPIGEDYRMQIKWTYSEQTFYDHVYFDVVHYPIAPMTSSRMLDDCHPDWVAMRPKEWRTWDPAIRTGHAELCRRIRALGNRPAFIVKREELQPYEQAFIEAVIARNHLGMQPDERGYWERRAETMWSSRGEFAYATASDDGELDDTPKVFYHRWSR